MDPLRDRIYGLLSDLCGAQADLSPDGLRLLSHTLMGVAREHAPTALFAVRDALPWVAALVECMDGTDPEAVADMLTARGVVRALDRATLSARLSDATQRRSGFDGGTPEARFGKVLRDLAFLDRKLVDLSMRSDASIRDTLLEDPALLAAAISICAGGEQTDIARRFRAALLVEDVALDPLPLRLLCDLETAWDGGAVSARSGFCDRTRRFEISACDHLRQSGLAAAVRAALLFGNVTKHGGDIRQKLRSFAVFADERPLEELAVALAENRGGVVRFLSGRAPLRSLDGWVRYLRGSCHELADTREISIREATSFAHYCLHLLNFCDLAARTDGAANDDARLAVMGVEDDLKEFALAGQRAGLSDDEVHLGRWDRARWDMITAEEQLVERLGRLAGCWRTGFVYGGSGVTSRLSTEVLDPWYEVLAEFDLAEEAIRSINTQLATMTVRGAELFETASPRHALRMLVIGAAAGTGHGALDFEPALSWFKDRRRRALAESMLDAMDDVVLRHRHEAVCGFVAERTSNGVTLTVRRHAEFEALLVLMQTKTTAPLMREMARQRLTDLVAVIAEPPSPPAFEAQAAS